MPWLPWFSLKTESNNLRPAQRPQRKVNRYDDGARGVPVSRASLPAPRSGTVEQANALKIWPSPGRGPLPRGTCGQRNDGRSCAKRMVEHGHSHPLAGQRPRHPALKRGCIAKPRHHSMRQPPMQPLLPYPASSPGRMASSGCKPRHFSQAGREPPWALSFHIGSVLASVVSRRPLPSSRVGVPCAWRPAALRPFPARWDACGMDGTGSKSSTDDRVPAEPAQRASRRLRARQRWKAVRRLVCGSCVPPGWDERNAARPAGSAPCDRVL